MQDIHASTSGGFRVEARAGAHVTFMDEPLSVPGGTNTASAVSVPPFFRTIHEQP